jgi:hypothetical protein
VAVVSVFGGFVLGMQTIRTPEKEAVILDALREHPSYNRACRKARIVKSSLWTWRRDDPAFAARCEAAREDGIDALEDALMERGTKDDTTAAIFLLKSWRRERYGDRLAVTLDVRQAAERAAAELGVPVDVVLAETYRMVEDGA